MSRKCQIDLQSTLLHTRKSLLSFCRAQICQEGSLSTFLSRSFFQQAPIQFEVQILRQAAEQFSIPQRKQLA